MKKSPTNYRAAQPADVSSIHSLIKELASFENAIEQVETDPAQLLMDGFSQNPAYQAFVADHNGQVVDFGVFNFSFVSHKDLGIFKLWKWERFL